MGFFRSGATAASSRFHLLGQAAAEGGIAPRAGEAGLELGSQNFGAR